MEKTVVELLKVKMLVVPGLIRLNFAALGGRGWGMMNSYVWLLFCSLMSGRYSAGNSSASLTANFIYFMKVINISLRL